MTTGPSDRGRSADNPAEIPARGWRDVLARTRREVKDDRVILLAAGSAFFVLLALVPALAALIAIFGLVADPNKVATQVGSWLQAVPADVRNVVVEQFRTIAGESGGTASAKAVLGLVLALWSASSGMAHLIQAINIAYDEEERRGFVKRRLLALGLTLGGIVFMAAAVGLIAVLPAAIADTRAGVALRWIVGLARWVVLLFGMLLALSVLYRFGPDRDDPKWKWTSPGAIVATLAWLVASSLFALYSSNFGKYNETYGSLSAVVVLMLWLFITMLCIIVGAELNAEVERQTVRDSTVGPPEPMGERRAEAADTVGPTADELKRGTGNG